MHLNASSLTPTLYPLLLQSASGTGLAFIVFTEAINQFPWAPFWSVLFFLMLFTLGIDSEFGTLEGVITSVVDLKVFPNLRKEILTGEEQRHNLCSLNPMRAVFSNVASLTKLNINHTYPSSTEGGAERLIIPPNHVRKQTVSVY